MGKGLYERNSIKHNTKGSALIFFPASQFMQVLSKNIKKRVWIFTQVEILSRFLGSFRVYELMRLNYSFVIVRR